MENVSQLAWFCLRSQPKHEHIAAARLRAELIEAFSPRIRFKRATRRGPSWFTEALFPGYLFARFDWQNSFRIVTHASGVAGIVHFGNKWPTIPDTDIEELRRKFGEMELHVVDPELSEGETVQIATGAFRGLSAVISKVMPSQERVKILLEFVGRQTAVEIDKASLISTQSAREKLL
jgi:transcriptional antiterminator RfaH